AVAPLAGHPGEAGARGWFLAPSVLAGEHAAGEREVREQREIVAGARREDIALTPPAQDAQLVLHADVPCRSDLLGRPRGVVEATAVEVRTADLAHLALTHELIE